MFINIFRLSRAAGLFNLALVAKLRRRLARLDRWWYVEKASHLPWPRQDSINVRGFGFRLRACEYIHLSVGELRPFMQAR